MKQIKKLTPEERDQIAELWFNNKNLSTRELGERFGVSKQNIWKLCQQRKAEYQHEGDVRNEQKK